mmetsp:Transcript_18866/g.40535  ORF Transcript_18866/g.40535 Transcript_18866/m.40535 type:complete len:206 (+) Transcript_18866:372-989(+)
MPKGDYRGTSWHPYGDCPSHVPSRVRSGLRGHQGPSQPRRDSRKAPFRPSGSSQRLCAQVHPRVGEESYCPSAGEPQLRNGRREGRRRSDIPKFFPLQNWRQKPDATDRRVCIGLRSGRQLLQALGFLGDVSDPGGTEPAGELLAEREDRHSAAADDVFKHAAEGGQGGPGCLVGVLEESLTVSWNGIIRCHQKGSCQSTFESKA